MRVGKKGLERASSAVDIYTSTFKDLGIKDFVGFAAHLARGEGIAMTLRPKNSFHKLHTDRMRLESW
jgi:hypothetical protein